MNYNNFKYDLNNVIDYSDHKYCFDQMIYILNDRYKIMGEDMLNKYYEYYISNITDKNKIILIKDKIVPPKRDIL